MWKGLQGHLVTYLREMVETIVNPATGSVLRFLGNPFHYVGVDHFCYPNLPTRYFGRYVDTAMSKWRSSWHQVRYEPARQ